MPPVAFNACFFKAICNDSCNTASGQGRIWEFTSQKDIRLLGLWSRIIDVISQSIFNIIRNIQPVMYRCFVLGEINKTIVKVNVIK